MTNSIIRRTGALLAAAALTVTLASCSGGQSVAEACKVAQNAMSEVNTNTSSMMQEAMSGDADYAELFKPVQEALADAESQVTNEEVSSALKGVSTEFNGLVDDLSGFEIPSTDDIDPTDPEAMAKLDKMQEDLTAVSEKLQERAQSLQDAGNELTSLCNAG